MLSNAQITESFNAGTLPAGWDLSNGMQVSSYNRPISVNNCSANFGLLTPGIGGNNPAKVLTPAYTYSSSASFINVGFTIFIFDANLSCGSNKNLPCVTFVQVYLVKSSVTTAGVPSNPSDILGQSQVQIVLGNAPNILYVAPTNPLPNGTLYRVLYDFSVAGNCNQGGTKYILDDFRVVTTTNGPLPVSLRNFNANLRNSNVSLSWITETENNAKGFAVERRMGNGAYVEIGFVNSKAINGTSSSTLEYNFSDANLKPSTVAQYRLRQVDLDGKTTYSEIRSVRNGAKNLIVSVYPNPSRGTTNISIPDGVGMVDLSLEDFTGKTIQRYNGINRNNMQLTNMKPGLYVVRVFVRETGESITERISVQ
jgi:hypothetical protein